MTLLLVPLATSAQTLTTDCLPEDCGGLCYTFTSPYPSGTLNNWDFEDGTIFLNTLGKGDTTATTAQLDTLLSIASQCPEEGGRGVLEAIVLYRALTGNLLETSECGTQGRSTDQTRPSDNTHFTLYPNPAHGITTVQYRLQENQTAELAVFDIAGKQLASYQLHPGNTAIQLEPLPSGIYFIRFAVNGKTLQTEKLVRN